MEVVRDKQLLGLFWELANENQQNRLAASETLTTRVLAKQKQLGEDELHPDLQYSFSRLVQGLASGRKCARLGFATALSLLLVKTSSSLFSSTKLLELMDTKLELSEISKSEYKDTLLGQLFCLLSLIRSNKLIDEKNNENLLKTVNDLIRLSKTKSYLKKPSFQGIISLMEQVSSETFKEVMWPALSPLLATGWSESCTPDTCELLWKSSQCHPTVCGNKFLEANHWITEDTKKAQIFNKSNFNHISRIIAETTQRHPQVDELALTIISSIGQESASLLGEFWSKWLTKALVFSTPERKYLAIKLAVYSLPYATAEQVPQIWSKDLLLNIHYALSHKDNPLYLMCKEELAKNLSEKLVEDTVSSEVQYALLFQVFSSPGGIHLDNVMHVDVIKSIVSHFKLSALIKYIEWLKRLFLTGTKEDTDIRDMSIDVARKWSATQLTQLMRISSLPRNESWMLAVAKFIFFHSRFTVKNTNKKSEIEEVKMIDDDFEGLSESSRIELNRCFSTVFTTLNDLVPIPVDGSMQIVENGDSHHVNGVTSSGDFWLSSIVRYADCLISSEDVQLVINFNETLQKAWSKLIENISKMSKIKASKGSESSEARAMELLLIHVGLQLLSMESELQKSSLDVFGDLQVIIQDRFGVGKKKGRKSVQTPSPDKPHWVEVIVEILLGMLSMNSHSARVTATKVFRLIMPHLTGGGLKLITDALKMKTNELTKQLEDEDSDHDEDEDDDDDDGDLDDEDEENDEVDSESSDDNDDNEVEEETVDEEFRNRVKEALGEAAAPVDEGSDDSDSDEDLSDDAMMRIDSVLSDVFKQRKQKSEKSEKKETKTQMIHFQIRCLNLLQGFINRCHGDSPLVLDLVFPLLDVIKGAMKDPDKQVLAEKATVILKTRLCKIRSYPRHLSDDVIERCHDNMDQLLGMCQRDVRGVFLSQLISSCCMLYIRVLIGKTQENTSNGAGSLDVSRVVSKYSALLDDFMSRRQSRVQHCLLADLTNRYPIIGQHLIEALIKYTKDGVQLYRKMQACGMLLSLFHSPLSRPKATSFAPSLITTVRSVIKQSLEDPSEFKPKYLVEVINLLPLPLTWMKEQDDDDEDWDSLVNELKELKDSSNIQNSQLVTSAIWKVLNVLGVSIPKEAGGKRKRKKQNKRKLRKENPEDDEEKNVENCEPPLEAGESKKEIRARVMKEKRKARKKAAVHNSKSKKTRGHVTNNAVAENSSEFNNKPKKKSEKEVSRV